MIRLTLPLLAGLGLALLLCAILGWCSQAGAETLPPPATHYVVWYQHEAEPGGRLYVIDSRTGEPAEPPDPSTLTPQSCELGGVDVLAQGYPVTVEWWAGDQLLKRCGTRPDRIMWDGFEGGNTARWRTP